MKTTGPNLKARLPTNEIETHSRTSPIGDTPRIIGTLTTRSNKPRRRSKARTYSSFGRTETHRVTVIELKPEDRGTLQAIAKRYRVKSLTRFLEGCLADEDAKKRKSLVPDLRGQKS